MTSPREKWRTNITQMTNKVAKMSEGRGSSEAGVGGGMQGTNGGGLENNMLDAKEM